MTALANKDNRTNVRLLALIARRMIQQFGGLDRTCDFWATEVRALMKRRPGSRLSIKTFQAIMYLVAVVDQSQRSEAEAGVAEMSTGQLAGLVKWLAQQRTAVETHEVNDD